MDYKGHANIKSFTCVTNLLSHLWPLINIIKSTPPSQPNKTDLSTCSTYVCPYVRLSRKRFSDLNKIWCLDRGRWVIHHMWPNRRSRSQRSKSCKNGWFFRLSPLLVNMQSKDFWLIMIL